jgi:hypothetical protein
VPGQGEG